MACNVIRFSYIFNVAEWLLFLQSFYSGVVVMCSFVHVTCFTYNEMLNLRGSPFILKGGLIWYACQNDCWSRSLANSYQNLLCAPSFPHTFVDDVLFLCIWFPSLVKVSLWCSVPLNRFLTHISSFLCSRIPRWFPANALHPLHKLLIPESHFLPLQNWNTSPLCF